MTISYRPNQPKITTNNKTASPPLNYSLFYLQKGSMSPNFSSFVLTPRNQIAHSKPSTGIESFTLKPQSINVVSLPKLSALQAFEQAHSKACFHCSEKAVSFLFLGNSFQKNRDELYLRTHASP